MIYTGQTGWIQGARYGIVLDAIVNDFVPGELEHAIVRCDREVEPDLIVIEGQSCLRNPSGPCGAEMLLSAAARGVVLQHAPGRDYLEGQRRTGSADPLARIGNRADSVLRLRNHRSDPEPRTMHEGATRPIPGGIPREAWHPRRRSPSPRASRRWFRRFGASWSEKARGTRHSVASPLHASVSAHPRSVTESKWHNYGNNHWIPACTELLMMRCVDWIPAFAGMT